MPLSVDLVCYGKLTNKYCSNEFDVFVKRLKRYCKFSVVELKECRKGDVKERYREDAESFFKKVSLERSYFIVLSEEGKLLSSQKMANEIEKIQVQGYSKVVFLIGAPYGIDESVKQKANMLLSLSPMTFTHDMARLIFIEQLYRWHTIIQNHPYHH